MVTATPTDRPTDRPTDPLGLLWYDGPAAVLAAPLERSEDGRWARAVALGATARYAEAHVILRATPTSRAASTRASFARQVGRHAEAAPLDERALALAETTGDRADATSGAVADALGAGDAERAFALLPAARLAASADGGWRSRTRLFWVTAELGLLAGEARTAAADADEAVLTARAAGAPRHLTKSLLIRGVARHEDGDPDAASDLLLALHRARTAGLVPLVWPAAAVAARACPDRTPALLREAADAAAAMVAGLGAEGPAFASRTDVVALLQQRNARS